MAKEIAFDFQSLRSAYAAGISPIEIIDALFDRIDDVADPGIFIHLRDKLDILADANRLDPSLVKTLPLWGIPFAIKDNINAAGLPTTAACPAYSYVAEEDAFVVARLRAAGALLIGKTNLDQFATGLVGVRTPYPVPLNALDPKIVPGGSSSGSAVAVAHGIVSFALGTDTAGSGRVPAALNGTVGLKPSLGALSNTGVVPACRTLDTISIFALTVDDAFDAFQVSVTHDPKDAYSKSLPLPKRSPHQSKYRIGIPNKATIEFFGDTLQEKSFGESVNLLKSLGAEPVDRDFTPFYEVAKLLYNGPWIAERHTVIESLLEDTPDAVHPVTRQITEVANTFSATDTFRAMYHVRERAVDISDILDGIDLLCVPSVPTFFTCADLKADPIGPNAQLGTYTNFVNLLDLCAVTVPTAPRDDNRPGSITLIAPSGRDGYLATLAAEVQQQASPRVGATDWPLPASMEILAEAGPDEAPLVVVGAHMSGLPLNYQLTDLKARFLRTVQTAEYYKFYKLAGDPPARPGLVRDDHGAAINAELWALPSDAVGKFLAGIPAPLGIGTVFLDDGSTAQGFLCEGIAAKDAEDITHFGGWRGYLASLSAVSNPDKEQHHATA